MVRDMPLNGLLLRMITFKSLYRWSFETCICLLALGRGQILTVVMFNILFQYSQYFLMFAGSVRHSVLWASSPHCLNILGLYQAHWIIICQLMGLLSLLDLNSLMTETLSQYLSTFAQYQAWDLTSSRCAVDIYLSKWAARRVDIKILVLLWLSICRWYWSPQSLKSTHLRCNSLNKGLTLNWLLTC